MKPGGCSAGGTCTYNMTPQVRNNASIVEEKTIEAATAHDLGATEKGKVKGIKEVQKDHQQKEDQMAGGRTSFRVGKTHGHDGSRETRAIGKARETKGEKVTVQEELRQEVIQQVDRRTRTVVQQQGVQHNNGQLQQLSLQQLKKKQ